MDESRSARRAARAWRFALSALALASLQACQTTNPLVTWTRVAPADQPARKLDDALKESAAARTAYQQKFYDQVDNSATLPNALILLGGAVAGLALGHGNQDAILGAGVLGGTAYSLGAWNLDARRLEIYGKAVTAFECVDSAVAPYDIPVTDYNQLSTVLEALPQAISDTQTDEMSFKDQLVLWTAGTPGANAKVYDEAIATVERNVVAAQAAKTSGDSLVQTIDGAGGQLIRTVHDIDEQARELLAHTVGDLSKVQGAVSGIGSAISFVPQSSVNTNSTNLAASGIGAAASEAQQGARVGSRVQKAPAPPAIPADVTKALSTLEASLKAMSLQTRQVTSITGRVATAAANSKAIADCGLGSINLGMSASPAKVIATAGKDYSTPVTIKGGRPPYAVKTDGVAIAGVTTPVADTRDTSNFDVKVDRAVASTVANFVILDSSVPANRLQFSVEVVGAPAPAPPAPAPPPKPAKPKATASDAAGSAPTQDQGGHPPVKPITPASAAASHAAASPAAHDLSATLATLRGYQAITFSGVKATYASDPMPSGDVVLVTLGCANRHKVPSHPCLPAAELHDRFFASFGAAGDGLRAQVRFPQEAPGAAACSCKT